MPSLPPRSSSLASKLLKAFNPVTTVADVIARQVAAAYSPPILLTLPRRKKAVMHEMTPIRTDSRGGSRRVTPPWRIDATRPIYPSNLPFLPDVNSNSSYVINDSELSIPEKKRRKKK
ncbi:hypothetical protein VFPPC_17684 [Pochonia chlamydosporia 170]|uniref:Uncharacterized protein n=1 Tax=Pochonia chlamydosporia 170 TaxID=1380566 RepID=A0A219AQU3_METCM|nr:hypothetical protein VFPPC_17684 [Pochonia chlamydosporia 170]OWT43140.1 hypothetical protein VFPPC_17684 [Pochonia chlamydosporia 170]